MKVTDLKTSHLDQACKEFQVRKLYVFGFVTSGSYNENSDLDFF